MDIISILFLAVALSMDAFAVSICKGMGSKNFIPKNALIIGLFFGFFQGVMPLIGWKLFSYFKDYITAYDHWIAFVLLALIGAKMIYEALSPENTENTECCSKGLDIKELLILSLATSIDAMAAGITFAIIPTTHILLSVSIIGLTTLSFSYFGVYLGNKTGNKFGNKAEIFGGVILICIGSKILIEHLGLI